ncbi:MAG: endonuclease/exonuclease/phosphatase family protein [Cyclobacteriaceae bacterium]|nr:endonuclease/exonuclease/phosphatase family protein [Cyclobacteriaceae bacterium]
MKILILFLVVMSAQITTAQSLKVMTYNIRLDVASDGVNQWSNRKDKVYALLIKYDPDFIGVQEALHHQLMDIKKNLPEYESIGVGRDDGKEKGEYSAILYKKNKFEVLEQSTAWLSLTPEIPGSKSWDAAITRIATWGRFKITSSQKIFLLLNTHFDHIGKEARKNSALLIQQWVHEIRKKYNDEVIVTGDFNIERHEAPYSIMMNETNTFHDTKPPSEKQGTFCTFTINSEPCKGIDYIFVTSNWKVSMYQVIEDNDGTYYPSDHLPVMITATLK